MNFELKIKDKEVAVKLQDFNANDVLKIIGELEVVKNSLVSFIHEESKKSDDYMNIIRK